MAVYMCILLFFFPRLQSEGKCLVMSEERRVILNLLLTVLTTLRKMEQSSWLFIYILCCTLVPCVFTIIAMNYNNNTIITSE